MIGDDIEITIVDIRGDKVSLGITAPITIPVHRKEVYDAIQRENLAAARLREEDLKNLPPGSTIPPSGPTPVVRPDANGKINLPKPAPGTTDIVDVQSQKLADKLRSDPPAPNPPIAGN